MFWRGATVKNILSDRVRVQIFGREYEVDAGGLTPLEVQSLTSVVDEKMREISESFSMVDTQKIAVLAAINIALDYTQLKEKGGTDHQQLIPQLEELDRILTEALNS